jgi:hypothetical protein
MSLGGCALAPKTGALGGVGEEGAKHAEASGGGKAQTGWFNFDFSKAANGGASEWVLLALLAGVTGTGVAGVRFKDAFTQRGQDRERWRRTGLAMVKGIQAWREHGAGTDRECWTSLKGTLQEQAAADGVVHEFEALVARIQPRRSSG